MIEGIVVTVVISLVPLSFVLAELVFMYGTMHISPEVVEALYNNTCLPEQSCA